jgi:hypothetical protein
MAGSVLAVGDGRGVRVCQIGNMDWICLGGLRVWMMVAKNDGITGR